MKARRISNRSTNNKGLVDIQKYNLYFYSSTATLVWNRHTDRESSHLSFFCGEDPFWEVVRRPENKHEGADRFTGVTSGPPPSLEWPVGLCLQSKITDLILSFKSHEHAFLPTYFSVYGGLSELTYFRFSGNLLILSANQNISHSIHSQ